MRIGIDGATWTNRRGYGRFLRELVRAIPQVDSRHEYVILLDSSADRDETWPDAFTPCFVPTSRSVGESATAAGRRSIGDFARMTKAALGQRLDLFFYPTVYSWFPLLQSIPTVVGAHDTIAERRPADAFSSRWNESLWRWKVGAALKRATLCLTVSEFSRRSIEEVYGFPVDRIRVAPEAAASIFRPGPVEREDFVLYAGGISPNKNLETLARAFARSRAPRLVLVGDAETDGFKSCASELRSLVAELGAAGRVEWTGWITDEALADLYRRAALFVMPSWEEGFGLPALEAMACGCPTAVSRGGALEEVAGGAAALFDAAEAEALAALIDTLLEDAERRRELSRAGLARAAEFSWHETARRVVCCLEEAALKPPARKPTAR